MTRRQSLKFVALAAAVIGGLAALATPLCIRVASADGCERMVCGLAAAPHPVSDPSWCEAWFDLFR